MAMNKEQIKEIVNRSKIGDTVELNISESDMKNRISLKGSRKYNLNICKASAALIFDLEISPDDTSVLDDKYTLFSTDENESYTQTLTVKDDKIDGDDKITLEYKDIIENLNYSLQVDTGSQGQVYFVFEDIPLEELY